MDCFYAAIEMRDFPEFATSPLAVGGTPNKRGVIAACNYAAREHGVHSAMATSKALRLCPNLVLQPGRMEVYKQESNYLREIFCKYTDKIEPLSLDEAYLDVTDSKHYQGSATLIAKAICKKIFETRRLTASAGVAPNKSLAKIASDWNKPNGIKVITPEEIKEFIINLPVRKLFGVGPVMEKKLIALGIKTCKQLQAFDKNDLHNRFGAMGERLYDLSRGVDDRPVNNKRIRKSMSVEQTFETDIMDADGCVNAMPKLLARLEKRMLQLQKTPVIHSIFVKIKFIDFTQTTVEKLVSQLEIIIINQLIKDGWKRKNMPIRLLGLGVKLQQKSAYQQLRLPGI